MTGTGTTYHNLNNPWDHWILTMLDPNLTQPSKSWHRVWWANPQKSNFYTNLSKHFDNPNLSWKHCNCLYFDVLVPMFIPISSSPTIFHVSKFLFLHFYFFFVLGFHVCWLLPSCPLPSPTNAKWLALALHITTSTNHEITEFSHNVGPQPNPTIKILT